VVIVQVSDPQVSVSRIIVVCSFNLIFRDSWFCIYLLMAYLTTLPQVQPTYHPAVGSRIGTDVETSSRVLIDVPSGEIAFRALATIAKNFNQDNRRPIWNSNPAPPGYKTNVTSELRRGVAGGLALLGCLLTTFRHVLVPTSRIGYVGNQLPTYTPQQRRPQTIFPTEPASSALR
jgi:hypothetical protein